MDFNVDWPTQTGIYKVVQVKTGETYNLIFGINPTKHADLLREFLEKNKIRYNRADSDPYDFIPALNGPDYNVIGMGMAIFSNDKTVHFKGASAGYLIPIEQDLIKKFKEIFTDRVITVS